jgi:agmatine/peptidylarginine deiminase
MTRYFPAEWHPQQAVQLTWPHSKTDWNWIIEDIQSFYIQLINTITEFENVIISVPDPEVIESIQSQLKNNHFECHFFICSNNDTWARDHGPIGTYEDKKLVIEDFRFNGWGGKFDARLDNKITESLFQQQAYQAHYYETRNFILEGGSIESDGNGCLLTTRQCLMNTNRNASLNQDQIEAYLKDTLGCEKFLWLKHGDLIGDDTDAHIDTLARFAPNNQIIFQGCQNTDDDHYNDLNAMKEELTQLTNINGAPFSLVELPWPDAIFEGDTNQRLPATYANFLFINGAVLLPIYNVKQDTQAIKVMKAALPNHKIIPINCSVVVRQYGSLHCLTMQIPTAERQEKI